MKLAILAAVLFFVIPARSQSTDPLFGDWVCDDMTIEVICIGEDVSGTIRRGGTPYSFTGNRVGDGWTGQFKSGENSFPCSGTLENGILTFRSGQKSYALRQKVKQARNPLDDGQPVTPAPNPLGDNPAPISPPAQQKILNHPQSGFSCEIPEGWRGQVSQAYVELFGPTSATTGQPCAYIRVAAVVDPTFTQITDARYLNGAVASMKQNEPGLTLEGDAKSFSKGTTHVAVIPFTLQVPGAPKPLPARAVLGEIANKKMAVIFMLCEESKLEECEGLAIRAADNVINGCKPVTDEPRANSEAGGSLNKAIVGTWSNEKWIWEFTDISLKKSMNMRSLNLGKDVVISSGRTLFHRVVDNKLYVAEKPTDAWDQAPDCEIYTIEIKGDELTLTDVAGQQTLLKRDKDGR